MTENEISKIIIECAIEVHLTLGGPGLLENVYEEALAWELTQRDLKVQRQVQLPIHYSTTAYLPEVDQTQARPGHQLRRETGQGWNSSCGQRPLTKTFASKDAKPFLLCIFAPLR